MIEQPSPPPAAPASRPRARVGWVKRLFLMLLVVAVAIAGLALYVQSTMRDVGTLSSITADGDVYLIVGSDSRANLPHDLDGSFGDFPGARADVIILAQVADDRRQLLSIPRDLKVEVPGHGTEKINAAFALGGPDLMIETVAQATGIRANHYLEIDFGGFAAIVDALGGIELEFPFQARDLKSGLLVQETGTVNVGGSAALAYARSREYEEFQDGQWVSSNAGDIARTGRQRQVLLQILSKASSPAGLIRSPLLAVAAAQNLSADSSTDIADLGQLALALQGASITDSITLPVQISNEGGVSYVVAVPPAADVLAAFANRQPLQ